MFTRNFYASLSRWLSGTSDASTTDIADGTSPYVLTNGGAWPTYNSYEPKYPYPIGSYWRSCITTPKFVAAHSTSSSSNAAYYYGVFFGTGNTQPSFDDYTFSGDFVTGCAVTYSATRTVEDDHSGSTVTVIYTITNNNDTSVTIGEIGMFHEVYGMTAYSVYSNMGIMIERTALETPITIEAGGVGQVTYTLNFNIPAASLLPLVWEEDAEYSEAVSLEGVSGATSERMVKISDRTEASDYFLGKTFRYIFLDDNGEEYAQVEEITSESITTISDDLYALLGLTVCTGESADFGGVTLTHGIWAQDNYTNGGPIRIEVTEP